MWILRSNKSISVLLRQDKSLLVERWCHLREHLLTRSVTRFSTGRLQSLNNVKIFDVTKKRTMKSIRPIRSTEWDVNSSFTSSERVFGKVSKSFPWPGMKIFRLDFTRRKGKVETNTACPSVTSALDVELERVKITRSRFQSAIHCRTSRSDLSELDVNEHHIAFLFIQSTRAAILKTKAKHTNTSDHWSPLQWCLCNRCLMKRASCLCFN